MGSGDGEMQVKMPAGEADSCDSPSGRTALLNEVIAQPGPCSVVPADAGSAPDLATSIRNLEAELAALRRTVENRLSYDRTKEEAFDRLYAELDGLKKKEAFDQLRPLYLDLILLFDRIDNLATKPGEVSQENPSAIGFVQTLSDELLEILGRREIEIISTASIFDPATQRAVGTQLTSNRSENSEIARVVRKGFRFSGSILRAEEVIVKKCDEMSEPLAKER